MPLRAALIDAYRAVATGPLRLDDDEAETFASDLTDAHAGLHVIGMLSNAPNGLSSEMVATMLDRWFRLLPAYDAPARLLRARRVVGALHRPVSGFTGLMLDARVFEVCISQRGLSLAQAREVAARVRRAAGAFVALEQRCATRDAPSPQVLCATLRCALGEPLRHAQRAAGVFLAGAEHSGPALDAGSLRSG